MRDFIDKHRDVHGVEPIRKVLQIAPSGYRRHAAFRREPHRRCPRVQRDEILAPQIERVWRANLQVYGADKVWRQLAREGTAVARCTVERLMRRHGLRGGMRGKVVRTTISDSKAPCPLDKVSRQFKAERSNQIWVADFTYVSTWQGWLYVAFVIDVFARRIVGWRVSTSMRTDFVLDALEQSLCSR
jgi:putative transposase